MYTTNLNTDHTTMRAVAVSKILMGNIGLGRQLICLEELGNTVWKN